MNQLYQLIIKKLGKNRILVNEEMSKYTSFKIGGPADLFYQANTVKELIEAYRTAIQYNVNFFILGGGTNLLVSDRGFRGLIIKNSTDKITLAGMQGGKINQGDVKNIVHTAYIKAESGVTVNRLVRYTLDQGLSGMEYFLGQPGSVGGSVYINSHNLKRDMFFGENIVEAVLLDKSGVEKTVSSGYFQFGYDESIIQKTKEVILSVIFKLKTENKDAVWARAQEALNYRKITQPYGRFTAGCTFRNISKIDALRLSTPNHTCSAGFLIDSVALKGKKIGGAVFSNEHANFIINDEQAKASDVIKLINLAKLKVKAKYHLELKEEIEFIGEF
jgi:UDP-N-acetylmuramate dehydrogenase